MIVEAEARARFFSGKINQPHDEKQLVSATREGLPRRLIIADDLSSLGGAQGLPNAERDRVGEEGDAAVAASSIDSARVPAPRGTGLRIGPASGDPPRVGGIAAN